MFLGTTDHNLDAKGRVILPTHFREELGESFYITMGFNRCVQVLSEAQFDRLRDQIRQLPADKALSLQDIIKLLNERHRDIGHHRVALKTRREFSVRHAVHHIDIGRYPGVPAPDPGVLDRSLDPGLYLSLFHKIEP